MDDSITSWLGGSGTLYSDMGSGNMTGYDLPWLGDIMGGYYGSIPQFDWGYDYNQPQDNYYDQSMYYDPSYGSAPEEPAAAGEKPYRPGSHYWRGDGLPLGGLIGGAGYVGGAIDTAKEHERPPDYYLGSSYTPTGGGGSLQTTPSPAPQQNWTYIPAAPQQNWTYIPATGGGSLQTTPSTQTPASPFDPIGSLVGGPAAALQESAWSGYQPGSQGSVRRVPAESSMYAGAVGGAAGGAAALNQSPENPMGALLGGAGAAVPPNQFGVPNLNKLGRNIQDKLNGKQPEEIQGPPRPNAKEQLKMDIEAAKKWNREFKGRFRWVWDKRLGMPVKEALPDVPQNGGGGFNMVPNRGGGGFQQVPRMQGPGPIQMPNLNRGPAPRQQMRPPKKKEAPIKELMDEYKKAQTESKKRNEDRAKEISAAYKQQEERTAAAYRGGGAGAAKGQPIAQVMTPDGYLNQARNTNGGGGSGGQITDVRSEEINRQYDQLAAKVQQQAISRGIGGTTVLANLLRGVEDDRQRALRQSASEFLQQKLAATNAINTQAQQFRERINEPGPDLNQYLQLAMMLGRSDSDAYDYGEV